MRATQSRSWQSPAVENSTPGQKHGKTTTQPSGCCRGLKDCLKMGSIVSTKRSDHEPTSTLEQQVADLEREVERQKEVRFIYKKRMERTQDYLRYCLQIAQENGFLDLIVQNKDAPPTPQTPTPLHQHSELASLIDVAKLNGWYIAPDEIELQEKIGHGSTANIHRGTWRGLDVAVKCIRPDFFQSNDKGVAFFAQEMETLACQRHRFVLQLMGACLDPPFRAWAVTEFLSMTLEEWLHGPDKRRIKERITPLPQFKERLGRALEIAQAMQYLHAQRPKVLHRDLKPSNIFLDDALHVRVADFGHARFLSEEEMALSGTYVYMAPEVIKCEPYNEKCDVYSFGIILNELMTGEYPYIELDYGPTKIAMEVVESNLRPRLREDDGQLGELIDLICRSWNEDAAIRPPFATITSVLKRLQNRLLENSVNL
ncbi:Putative serine/threonine-protein kinase/receptor [Morus notabilis]|uniref:Putative serine/threonine-protein kinase/receptor n=1 Tax=Morus notabilis TaxID=981085 RepID=W9RF43_9ROSA|nr:Putative serine/threonine-protein kinase/receptor [Morus notabilis]